MSRLAVLFVAFMIAPAVPAATHEADIVKWVAGQGDRSTTLPNCSVVFDPESGLPTRRRS